MATRSKPKSKPRPQIPGVILLRDPLNIIALACALAWGLMAVFGRPIGDYGVETDFYGDFVPRAKKWMEGEAQVGNGYRGPAYYLVLGVLGSIFRDYFMVGKLLSVFTNAGTPFLTRRDFLAV